MKINDNYKKLAESYLFSTIAKKVETYRAAHPEAEIIRMGIGDVTLPICERAAKAFAEAAFDQGRADRFHGYGPEQGYEFLRKAIQRYYETMGVELSADEIFVSDGAKSDLGNILDLFASENTVVIPDPVYPVYLDTNLMAGRTIRLLDANEENGFLPMPPQDGEADIIYLCSPNNPTGAVYRRDQLKTWVDYAVSRDAVILFDAAYESFITDPELPRSIFEIEGAGKCAIEFCSLSKLASFTGTRCGYTVVPKTLERCGLSLRNMWLRRQTTKFNGVSYPVQRAAEAAFSEEGIRECLAHLDVYQENARLITETLKSLDIWHIGGTSSPYIWMKCPLGMKSWEFFDDLLEKTGVVGTPGSGFGANGEGYFRLTAFGTKENTKKAMERMRDVYGGR